MLQSQKSQHIQNHYVLPSTNQVMNIKKAVIHYNITNEVNETVVVPCIRISNIINQPHFPAK